MTYDKKSDELTAVVSSGQKVSGGDMGGKVRRAKFTNVVLLASETGQLTTELPAGASLLGYYIENDSAGAGTVNIGLSNGTATDIATAFDPLAAGAALFVAKLDIAVGGSEVYVTEAGGAAPVTISGWLLYTAGA